MLVEIVDSLEEVFGDGLGRFEIGVVQRGLLQDQEPGLDQVQPGGVGGSPYEFHVVGHGTPQVQVSAMCAEVVPNQIDLAVRAIARKQRVLEKA